MKTLLQPGDEIRIVAPSRSWPKKRVRHYQMAARQLERLGYRVTYAKRMTHVAYLGVASPEDRAKDLHEAYADPNVKLIMALRGGWSVNDILPYVDWNILKKHPKPFVGYSDITALVVAITAQTGQTSYLGPNLPVFSDKALWAYSYDNMLLAVSGEPFELAASRQWKMPGGDVYKRTPPLRVLQPGVAKGVLRGGNIATTYLVQGTPYDIPYTEDYILALEDDDEAGDYCMLEFARRLESLLQQPGARMYLRGIAIGQFLPGSKMRLPDLKALLAVRNLAHIPIVYGFNFGHTLPVATLPFGAQAELYAEGGRPTLLLNA